MIVSHHPSPPRLLGARAAARDASFHWLALGLLLAAWNAADDGPRAAGVRRPPALAPHPQVSVRAVRRLHHVTNA